MQFTSLEEKKFSQYHTKSLKAVTYFGQGLGALDAGEWKEAKRFFEHAVREDPSFKLAILYRDASPAASAPSISALGAMADAEIADNTDAFVSGAMALQSAINDSPNDPGDVFGAEAPATTGTVTISW